MKRLTSVVLLGAIVIAAAAMASTATKADADHAIAAARAKMSAAASMQDQWLATVAAFKAARMAEAKGDFVTAESQATRAETLANLSIAQAKSQQTLWQHEVVR